MSSTRPVVVQLVKGLHKGTFFVRNTIFAGTHGSCFSDGGHIYRHKLTVVCQ